MSVGVCCETRDSQLAGWKVKDDFVCDNKAANGNHNHSGLREPLQDCKLIFSECSFYTGDLQDPSNVLLRISEESLRSDMLGRFVAHQGDASHDRNLSGAKPRRGRIWGSEWGLVPWRKMVCNPGTVYDNRGTDKNCKRKFSPVKSDPVFLANSRKPFHFQHSTDFKEYIRSYRESHSQAVILREKESSNSAKKPERIPVASALAEGTDLSTLAPKPEQQQHQKISQHSESVDVSERVEKFSPKLEMNRYCDAGVPSGERYGCSKGMAVYRKGVNLSPIKKPTPPDIKFDIVAAMDLARQEERRRNSSQDKYLNLKSYKIDKHIHNHVQVRTLPPEKKGKCLEYGDRNCIHNRKPPTVRRASFSQIKAVKVVGLQTSWKSSVKRIDTGLKTDRNLEIDLTAEKFQMVTSSSGIRFPASAQHEKPDSLYLGYCLSQLSVPNNSLPDNDDNKFATYQVQGRQLRGDIITPRSVGVGSPCSDPKEDVKPSLSTNPFTADIPDEIKLGVKGNTLQSHLHRPAKQTTSLGIFDMPV